MQTLVARAGFTAVLAAVLLAVASSAFAQGGTILIQEDFESTNFGSRGWYDTTGGTLSTTEKFSGARALECRFTLGGTNCSGGTPGRHLFTDSESVYIAYYIKHSTSWVGSGQSFHPHMFYFLSDLDGTYSGPAYNFLDAYIENIGGKPAFLIQDGKNIDETRVGQNLVNVTENRAVAGCNGDSDGYGNGDCYQSGSVHWNGKRWLAGQVYFNSTVGSPYYKGDWHLVEAYFKLNSIVGGKGAKDGIIRYWYDGALIMEHTDIAIRTGAHPTLKFRQLLVAPYIGSGSPADQTFWIDDLMIATGRPATPPVPPGSGATAPSPPANLRIIR